MKPALRPRILSQLRDMLAEREADVEALQARLRAGEGSSAAGSCSGLVVALERRLEALDTERAAQASEAERWRAEAELLRSETQRLKARLVAQAPEQAEPSEAWGRERETLHKRLASAVEEASMLRSQLQSRQADVARLERRVSELENLDGGSGSRGAGQTFGSCGEGGGMDETHHLLATPASLPTAAPSPMFPLPSPGLGIDHGYHSFGAAGPPMASSHWLPRPMGFTPQSSARGMQPPSYCPAVADGPLLRCSDAVRRSFSGGPCASFAASPAAQSVHTAHGSSPFNGDAPSDSCAAARRPSPLRESSAQQPKQSGSGGLWTPPPPGGRPEGRAKSVEPAQSEPLAAALGRQLQHLMAQPLPQSLGADRSQQPLLRSQSVPVHVRRLAAVPVPVSQAPANLARWASIPPSAGTTAPTGTLSAPCAPIQMHADAGSYNCNGPSPAGDFRVPPSNR